MPRPRPSSLWNGLSDWPDDPTHWLVSRAQPLLASIPLPKISALAHSLRPGFNCTVSETFACGTENLLREIIFEDDVIWIIRLPF
jgi:hypothetical protein